MDKVDSPEFKAAILAVKEKYPDAFAERTKNGCMIRQSLARGIVIGHVSRGDHVDAWIDAAKRLSENKRK